MDDQDLLRYSRHLLLEEIGVEGQERIRASRALVIGAGGLGSPVALYLGSAGVGHITLVDHDVVDLTNLQRQIAHTQAWLGQPKVASAASAIHERNPSVTVHALAQRADEALLQEQVAQADVVLDCCDNFATRHAINRACVRLRKPLVSGAAIRFDGQLAVFDPRQPHCPCYACVFPPDEVFEEARCATMGVFAPLVGLVGSMQAAQALKLLCGADCTLGQLLMVDARSLTFTPVQLARRADCPVCA
jgi:molybdopterin/thiamine biosynthesis adenylyltransferase